MTEAGDMDPQRKIKDDLRAFYARNVRYHELIDSYEKSGYTYDDILESLVGPRVKTGLAVRLLDIAMGTGYYIDRAREMGAEAYGADLSIHACRIARSRHPDLRICRSDAELLPFRSGVFDIVLCLQLIEHVPKPENVLAEVARVLKPGGMLFLSAPNMLGSNLLSRTLRAIRGTFSREVKRIVPLRPDILQQWDGASKSQDVADQDACNRSTVFHARNLLRRNGLEILHLDTLRHPKKYRPLRYAFERMLQKVPLLRYTGINFKILARKR